MLKSTLTQHVVRSSSQNTWSISTLRLQPLRILSLWEENNFFYRKWHNSKESRLLIRSLFFHTSIDLARSKALSSFLKRMTKWSRSQTKTRTKFTTLRQKCFNSVNRNSSLAERVMMSIWCSCLHNWSRKYSWKAIWKPVSLTTYWAKSRKRSCQCN